MTVDDLLKVAPLMGTVIIALSILYLAFQIRSSTMQMRQSDADNIRQQVSLLRREIMNNRDIAVLSTTGLVSPNALDAVDQVRLDALVGELMSDSYRFWERVRIGVLPRDEWDRSMRPIVYRLLGTEGGARYWKENQKLFHDRFRKTVNDIAAQLAADAAKKEA